jgi:Arc/MetJ-type ribon-helix-helix transcriptional regulator
MKKDVMISIRITPQQYVTLLETLLKMNVSKSEFIRQSLVESLGKMNHKSCRKKDVLNWLENNQ